MIPEYIERDKAIKKAVSTGLCDAQGNMYGAGDVVLVDDIKSIPSSDVVPLQRGMWKYYHKQGIAVCTCCSFERKLDDDFGRAISCPNCGANMDKEEKYGLDTN